MGEPLVKFWAKGVRNAPTPPRYGLHWILARRGRIRIYNDRLEQGSWRVPFSDIDRAKLWRARSWFGLVSPILELNTASGNYQFGLNPRTDPAVYFPWPVDEEAVRLKTSPSSVLLRAIYLALIIWLLWNAFGGAS